MKTIEEFTKGLTVEGRTRGLMLRGAKPPGRIRSFIHNAAGMALVGGLLAGKVALIRAYMRHRANKQKMLNSNRLVFSKLPRRKQYAVLHYRRQQLGSMESIYKTGQYQRGMGIPRRRRMF